MSGQKPIICTLTDEDRRSRTTTWHDVMRNALTRIDERIDGYTLALDFKRIDFEQIYNLIQAERECCQWMHLDLHDRGQTTLEITSGSPDGKAAIKNMLGL